MNSRTQLFKDFSRHKEPKNKIKRENVFYMVECRGRKAIQATEFRRIFFEENNLTFTFFLDT